MQKSTIELKHRDKINSYNQDYFNNEKLKEDIKNIEETIRTETNIQNLLSLNNDLNSLKLKVQKNETKENEIEYLLNVIPILNKYNDESVSTSQSGQIHNFITQTKGKEKGTLYNEFMNIVENKAIEITKKENVYF